MAEINTTIGQRIRARRQALDMSVEQVAERVGLAATTLRNYESANRTPSNETLKALAKVLNCSAAYLATYEDEENPESEFIAPKGTLAGLCSASEIGFTSESLIKKNLNNNNLLTFIVDDDTLEPVIKEGATTLIDITDKKIKKNNYYLIKNHGRYVIRKLRYSETSPGLIMEAGDSSNINPVEITLSDNAISIIGRVVAAFSWF